ncbi:unnamed protein product [Protopolystoma xenopodis]|uniref:Uncharacterized protein n=1 Tax=Protopolystoma xenopodis TaxID=117903 RepID=A0A3S5CGW9_9PLAT|nr:unnamed protein product [Protopolystoma xenopodis]
MHDPDHAIFEDLEQQMPMSMSMHMPVSVTRPQLGLQTHDSVDHSLIPTHVMCGLGHNCWRENASLPFFPFGSVCFLPGSSISLDPCHLISATRGVISHTLPFIRRLLVRSSYGSLLRALSYQMKVTQQPCLRRFIKTQILFLSTNLFMMYLHKK